METPYAKVTIESSDGETASIHSLTWFQIGSQKRPDVEEVVAAIAHDLLNQERLLKELQGP